MRKYILLFSSIFLIMGCASTSKIQIVEKPKTRREIIYDTHPVNVSLETNQELLIKLNNKLITFAKYDSVLASGDEAGAQALLDVLITKLKEKQ